MAQNPFSGSCTSWAVVAWGLGTTSPTSRVATVEVARTAVVKKVPAWGKPDETT